MSVCVLLLQINCLCWLDGLLLLRQAPENRSPNLHAIKCLHFKHFNPLIEKRKLIDYTIHTLKRLTLSFFIGKKTQRTAEALLEVRSRDGLASKLSNLVIISDYLSECLMRSEEWSLHRMCRVPGVLGRRHCPIQLSGTRTRRCSPGLSLSQDF